MSNFFLNLDNNYQQPIQPFSDICIKSLSTNQWFNDIITMGFIENYWVYSNKKQENSFELNGIHKFSTALDHNEFFLVLVLRIPSNLNDFTYDITCLHNIISRINLPIYSINLKIYGYPSRDLREFVDNVILNFYRSNNVNPVVQIKFPEKYLT